MTALAFAHIGFWPTRGSSETSRYVARQTEKGRHRLNESYSLGLAAKGVFDDLFSVARECSTANWDGYGAEAVTQETLSRANSFLEALPLGTPAPSAGAEPDGHLTLEWHHSPRRTLSVSVSPDGDLHYAALLGRRKAFGTEPFFGEVPTPILDLIWQITKA